MVRSIAPLMNVLLAGLALASTLQADPPEMRGVWVVRTALASPESADAVVDDAARAGLNALFVQVRGRGDALYRSAIVPRSEVLRGQPADFDPLARILARARARGLQVHAWINVLLAGGFGVPLPAGHVAAVHPEWLMVPRSAAVTGARDAAGRAGRADRGPARPRRGGLLPLPVRAAER